MMLQLDPRRPVATMCLVDRSLDIFRTRRGCQGGRVRHHGAADRRSGGGARPAAPRVAAAPGWRRPVSAFSIGPAPGWPGFAPGDEVSSGYSCARDAACTYVGLMPLCWRLFVASGRQEIPVNAHIVSLAQCLAGPPCRAAPRPAGASIARRRHECRRQYSRRLQARLDTRASTSWLSTRRARSTRPVHVLRPPLGSNPTPGRRPESWPSLPAATGAIRRLHDQYAHSGTSRESRRPPLPLSSTWRAWP